MLEALATIGVLVIGCAIEMTLAIIAVKVNYKVVEKQFKLRNPPGENS